MLLRFLTLLAVAIWLGGFTFYASVVIPAGHDVLGTHREVGFITRQVTHWLNAFGAVALLALLANALAHRRAATPRLRTGLLLTWLGMAAAQAGLFALHPVLDAMLDPPTRAILDPGHFYGWHRAYLIVATIQLAAAFPHLWMVLRLWAGADAEPLRG